MKRLLKALRLRSKEIGDDWNHWWAEKFDRYALVPTQLENVVEFGCGPYTNVRIIREGRTINHLLCSDPLIKTYLGFRYTWLSESYRKHEILVDDHPLEDAPFADGFFDLVVMINVLDHVCDAIQCMRQAIRVVRSGGLILLGQDLTADEDLPVVAGDLGHPIRVDQQTLDSVLLPEFEKVTYKILSREEGRNPVAHYATYIFAGKRLRVPNEPGANPARC